MLCSMSGKSGWSGSRDLRASLSLMRSLASLNKPGMKLRMKPEGINCLAEERQISLRIFSPEEQETGGSTSSNLSSMN